MTENVIIAIVGAVGGIAGAFAQQMQADNALLWQWNRQLVDHIYKGLGPPPPEPPENLFDHDD